MESDYDYITIWMTTRNPSNEDYTTSKLSNECVEWLETNVGKGLYNFHAWLLSHDDDDVQWCYLGFEWQDGRLSDYRKFMFKDRRKAFLFKLIWGGK
jgi:hypothetical protein